MKKPRLKPSRAGATFRRFRRDEAGATAIEYGLIVGLIFLAIVSGIRGFTSSASDMYEEIDTAIDSVT